MKIDLKVLRDRRNGALRNKEKDLADVEFQESVKLTQRKIADALGRSQAQISRWEADSTEIPMDVLVSWLNLLGTDLPTALASPDAEPEPLPPSPDCGTPYQRLFQDLRLVRNYVATTPDADRKNMQSEKAPGMGIDDLERLLDALERKPNVVLAGMFDSGKSRMANFLLGQQLLPEGYQPLTRLITMVRHQEDRPVDRSGTTPVEWWKEDVWIFRKGFDHSKFRNREHCEKHRVVVGGLGTLRDYVSRRGRNDVEDGHTAVIFNDAPILRSCNLVDLPGDSANRKDTELARAGADAIDVLLYMSQARGFLNQGDLVLLGWYLRRLPALERLSGDFSTLGHLFVVASHADPRTIDDSEVSAIREIGSRRLWHHMEQGFVEERQKLTGRSLLESDVAGRIYPFWAEHETRREGLVAGLTRALAIELPNAWKRTMQEQLTVFKERGKRTYTNRIDEYQAVSDNLAAAIRRYEVLREAEPSRKRTTRDAKLRVLQSIKDLGVETDLQVRAMLTRRTSPAALVDFIKRNFSSQKDAQSAVLSTLSESLMSKVGVINDAATVGIHAPLEDYLMGYSATLDQADGPSLSFDARAELATAIRKDGGALSAWASKVRVLRVEEGFSWAWVAGMAGMGAGLLAVLTFSGLLAPIVIGIMTTAAGWAISVLTGDSWEERLAKKVRKTLKTAGVKKLYRTAIRQFWQDTETEFLAASSKLDSRYTEYLDHLGEIYEDKTSGVEVFKTKIHTADALRDLFAGLRWSKNPPTD